MAYIIDRKSFDHFLVKDALSKGVELWEETEFILFKEGKKITVETSRGKVEADFLIGADGFYTKVGRGLGYRKEKFFRSVELFTEGKLRDRVIIDIGVVKRGYAWIFPKGERVAVGLATTGRENLLETLRGYLSSHRLLRDVKFSPPKGWMIPFITKEGDAQLGRGRVLLVGDAASLVDPLLGEGIYYALLSARLLARSISTSPDSPLTSYRELLRREVIPELVYAGRIAGLAYRFQRTAFRMGRGYALDRFLSLLLGEIGYREAYIRGLPEFLKSLLPLENFLHIIIDKIQRRR